MKDFYRNKIVSRSHNKNRVNINIRTKAFFESKLGKLMRKELVNMTQSNSYNTTPLHSTYDIDGEKFVDRHMNYMSKFPTLNCPQYVSNLKLMTKK